MPDSATIHYHDIYTAAKSGNVFSTEQLIFLCVALFILAVFLVICFASTILIIRWMSTGSGSEKAKCTGDEEDHYRMRQEVSEWKLTRERLVDLERKLNKERDTSIQKFPSTVIKVDQPTPPTINDHKRECHSIAPDMTQIMNLLGQRPFIQTVYSQPPMPMPMHSGYAYQVPYPQPVPPQGFSMPQHPPQSPCQPAQEKVCRQIPEAQSTSFIRKHKRSTSGLPAKIRTNAMKTISLSTPQSSKSKNYRHCSQSRISTQSQSQSQLDSRTLSPSTSPLTLTETDNFPPIFKATSNKFDLLELSDISGDHRIVSSHTSDLGEFSNISDRRRHCKSRSKPRTPSVSSVPSSITNSDLTKFSVNSRKNQSQIGKLSVPSTSAASTFTIEPQKEKSSPLLTSKKSSVSRKPNSKNSTLSVEMSPTAKKDIRKVTSVGKLKIKPNNATITLETAKYRKTKNRKQRHPQFPLVSDKMELPATNLRTSISSSVNSPILSTPTCAPKKKFLPKVTRPNATIVSPITSTWARRPQNTISASSKTSPKLTDDKTSATSTGISTSLIEKPNFSSVSVLKSDSCRTTLPEIKLEGSQNNKLQKQLRRDVPVQPCFTGALTDTLARHDKADHQKPETWRYQFVPEDAKLHKVFWKEPILPALNLLDDVTQKDETVRQEAKLHRLYVPPRTIGGVVHAQASRAKFDSTTFPINEQFVIVPDDEGFKSEPQSISSGAVSTASTSQPIPQLTPPQPEPPTIQTPNIADKIYQSRNPYWRARVDESAPIHDIANVRHILSPRLETAISKPPSVYSPDAAMLARNYNNRRRNSLTASIETMTMPAPLNTGLFVRPEPFG